MPATAEGVQVELLIEAPTLDTGKRIRFPNSICRSSKSGLRRLKHDSQVAGPTIRSGSKLTGFLPQKKKIEEEKRQMFSNMAVRKNCLGGMTVARVTTFHIHGIYSALLRVRFARLRASAGLSRTLPAGREA